MRGRTNQVTNNSARWWLRTLLITCMLGGHWVSVQGQPDRLLDAQHTVVRLERADFRLTQDPLPPDSTAVWQRIALPDNWNVTHPGQGGHGWYRFRFQVEPIPATPQAIYFPRASMNATVYLNGVLIDNSGGLSGAAMRNWNRPFLIPFLPRYLQAGNNELLIRVDADADDMGGLSAVEVGQLSVLSSSYQQRRFIQLVIPQFAEVVMALVGLVTLGFWLLLKDPLYGYFTLVLGAHFVRNLDFVLNDLLVPTSWIQMGVVSAVCWFVIFLALFSMRLLRLNWPKVERGLLALSGLVALAFLLLGGSPWAASAALGLHVAALGLGLVVLAVLMPHVGRSPYVESLPLTGAGMVSLALGVHDVLQRVGWLSTHSPRLSHLAAPVLILTMAIILFSRYLKNTMHLEQANRNLEQEVEQKTAQLLQTLRTQHQLEQGQAVLQERELILREMHDGVGNYLTIALRTMGRAVPDMALLHDALKSCMLDLRLMVDSLGASETGADTVATVLGNLRYRIEPALKAEGMALVWEVSDVDISQALTPRSVLNLTRIFQEAFTNVLKHANASQVVLRAEMSDRHDGRWTVITLLDDGLWLASADMPSHGLGNMRRRAEQLGGKLLINRTPTGSSVELSLPALMSHGSTFERAREYGPRED